MKVTAKYPVLNLARSLLNQEGYIKDFGDFYLAGKALNEWPKSKLLPPNAPVSDLDALYAEDVEFEVSEEVKKLLKGALKHYLDQKKTATEWHYQLCVLLQIDPTKSLV